MARSTKLTAGSLIFWDVDTQFDFIHPDGKLYVGGAESIIENLRRLTDHAHAHGIRIVASADDHVMSDDEISTDPDFETTYPPHCIHGTPGQAKIKETTLREPLVIEPSLLDDVAGKVQSHDGDILIHKRFFDVFTNENTNKIIDVLSPDEIVLYGVALDVCNRFAVEGILARRTDIHISVVTDAVKAIDRARGDALLKDWSTRGVGLIDTAAALERI
ncbi:MAG: isochorismatase family protein [Gammaproteobacteria bacterium]|nr:isochorismatase family protein [Gammaproteobacteria bacterium]